MHETPAELYSKLQRGRRSSKGPVDILRTRVWLEALLRQPGVSRKDIGAALSSGEPSGIVLRWLKGEYAAKPGSVSRLAKAFPGSDEIYRLPLFDLLQNRPLRLADLQRITSQYFVSAGPLRYWDFPCAEQVTDSGQRMRLLVLEPDSSSLFERGDINGFIGILYLLRKAEASGDAFAHFTYLCDAYRSLPGACRHVALRNRWRELLDCLELVSARVPTSTMLIQPSREIMERQIKSKTHITRRIQRPRDPKTLRFLELEVPYTVARIETYPEVAL